MRFDSLIEPPYLNCRGMPQGANVFRRLAVRFHLSSTPLRSLVVMAKPLGRLARLRQSGPESVVIVMPGSLGALRFQRRLRPPMEPAGFTLHAQPNGMSWYQLVEREKLPSTSARKPPLR